MFQIKLVLLFFFTGFLIANAELPLYVSMELTGDDFIEAEMDMEIMLERLAASNGPKYELVEIMSVRRTPSPGVFFYKYKLKLRNIKKNTEPKVCSFLLYSREGIKAGDVTIKCEGEEKIETQVD